MTNEKQTDIKQAIAELTGLLTPLPATLMKVRSVQLLNAAGHAANYPATAIATERAWQYQHLLDLGGHGGDLDAPISAGAVTGVTGRRRL